MKKRIDVLLVEKGIAPSREKAKIQIIAGNVNVGGIRVKSPSDLFEDDSVIGSSASQCPYVSRGGLKLEKALHSFLIDLNGKICADIGASTGGFTDCMLQNGAARVYAVDVGYGQFDWKLRNDPRVELLERTNARYLEPLDNNVEFTSIDVSFISLALIFPTVVRISGGRADIVALIKPQFEAGKKKVGKKGVVKGIDTHIEVIENVKCAASDNGLAMVALDYSPIKGPNGNIEFLAHFITGEHDAVASGDIDAVAKKAHETLG